MRTGQLTIVYICMYIGWDAVGAAPCPSIRSTVQLWSPTTEVEGKGAGWAAYKLSSVTACPTLVLVVDRSSVSSICEGPVRICSVGGNCNDNCNGNGNLLYICDTWRFVGVRCCLFCLPRGVAGYPLIPMRFGCLLIYRLCFVWFGHDVRHRCEMTIILLYKVTANMLLYEMT